MIENVWKDDVSDETITLLEKSIERRISSMVKHPWLPFLNEKTVVTSVISKYGQKVYNFETVRGLDSSRGTAPRDFDKVDVFWYNVFLNLSEQQQAAVLINVDPFDEMKDLVECRAVFCKCFGEKAKYGKILGEAMSKMQELSEKHELVDKIEKDSLCGWGEIALYLGKSAPTVMKMAKFDKLPVILVGGVAFSKKKKIDDWIENEFKMRPYWKVKTVV